jgi:hypothetical protein
LTEKPLAFLTLVKTLESAVGHKTKYALLDPFPCKTLSDGKPAIIPIQKAGNTIAHHLGLEDLTFVISVTRHDSTTAGHIDLSQDGKYVFVELASDICEYQEAVLATLCHELSHKFLHTHGIRQGTVQLEQEFLTDVTAVYLGLGKMMLNGCDNQAVKSRIEGGQTVTTTHVLKTGYISRECFAFVYLLVCAMRGIPRQSYMSGLNWSARDAVLECEQSYSTWFNAEYRFPEGIRSLEEDLRRQVMASQDAAAERHRVARRLEQRLGVIRSRINNSHEPLHKAQRRIADLAEPGPDPHLNFLNCLETREAVAECASLSESVVRDLSPEWEHVKALSSRLKQPEHDSEVVECPLDGTRLRVPSGRNRLLVTCSSCKYSFVVTTAHEDASSMAGKSREHRRKSHFLGAFRSLFARG